MAIRMRWRRSQRKKAGGRGQRTGLTEAGYRRGRGGNYEAG